ncbi:MAG TPA: HD domain-containing phosphohydrolase [Desulfobacterales bacterium]
MKINLKNRVSVADSMVLIGIGLAASYWVLESLLNIFTSRDVSFFNHLLGPDINEIWPRIIVFCLFIFFGSHVQFTINNRKNAEEALKESEEKYRTILESIEEGYYEIDLKGKLNFFNDSACRMLGYPCAELDGTDVRNLVNVDNLRGMRRVFRRVLTTGSSADMSEVEILRKDGRSRILELSVSLKKNREGRPIGFGGVMRDVTERLRNEREKQKLAALLHEARSATILGLAKLAEYRDEGTGKHLERIREYSRLIAEQMAKLPKYRGYITTAYIEDIYRSSILHDIGKVGIPDAILLKPEELTEDEFEVIKTHTVLGGEALNAIDARIEGKSFLTLGKEIAYHHHEKWDGSGYPMGLNAEQIPLSARMVALADVYDALTSKRFYKEAYSHDRAREIIVGLRGSHFDPDVVDVFLKVEDHFRQICKELREEQEILADNNHRFSVGGLKN